MSLTYGELANEQKEIIKAALRGKIMITDSEGNSHEIPAPKGVCDQVILEVFDDVVFQALDSMISGRALSNVMSNHGLKVGDYLMEYLNEVMKENKKYKTYKPEATNCDF